MLLERAAIKTSGVDRLVMPRESERERERGGRERGREERGRKKREIGRERER
jgi:hypothetical protein